MKLHARVTHISNPIEVKKKDGEITSKTILCVEEINEEKEQPERIAIDFMGDKEQAVSSLHVGDVIDVHFNLLYNRFDGDDGSEKIYNSVRGWKVAKIAGAPKKDWGDLPF